MALGCDLVYEATTVLSWLTCMMLSAPEVRGVTCWNITLVLENIGEWLVVEVGALPVELVYDNETIE